MTKELKTKFTKYNKTFNQIFKNQDGWNLFEITDGDYSYWELFRYKVKPLGIYATDEYDTYEWYPSDEDFGSDAFCLSNLNRIDYLKSKWESRRKAEVQA